MRSAVFAGRLGRDAELKFLPSGEPVLNFALAVSTGTKEKPDTLWVDCALFGKRAESLGQYLNKGTALTVGGDVGIRTWISKTGDAGGTITCRVDKVTFGGKSEGSPAQPAPGVSPAPPTPSRPAAQSYAQASQSFDEDIPF